MEFDFTTDTVKQLADVIADRVADRIIQLTPPAQRKGWSRESCRNLDSSLEELLQSRPDHWFTRTEIHKHFSHNITASLLSERLGKLIQEGLVEKSRVKGDGQRKVFRYRLADIEF